MREVSMMQIYYNEVTPDEIRYESMNGRKHLVFPLKPIKPKRLHLGYVPEEHVKKSTPDWNGTPLTLNHPRDAQGEAVSANSPDVIENTKLGQAFNFPHELMKMPEGEGWIDIEKARNIGGEAEEIVERLENGDPISVSSSYRGDMLPPGEYDGEFREQVRGNLRPDHVALLPNKKGQCSIDEGCMAGAPAVNAEDDIDRTPPEEAQDTAQMVKRLDDEYGVTAMREEGWARTNQLADGEEVSWDVISRMAQFERHQGNTEYENASDVPDDVDLAELAKDDGTMAWFGWGGRAGVNWAQDMIDQRESTNLLFPISDDGQHGGSPEDSEEQNTQMQHDLTLNKSVGGIMFTGLMDGDLDKSEIPNDDYEQHYVFDEDTKSESSFPLVDAEGNLRFENVAAAYRWRGDAPDQEMLLSVLEEVNGEFIDSDEFDEPPIDPENFDGDTSTNSLIEWGRDKLNIFTNNSMSDKIAFLVNERGYDKENLPPESSECFDKLHSNEKKLAEMEQSDNDDPSDDDPSDDADLDAVMNQIESLQEDMVTADEVQDQVEQAVNELDEKSEKQDIADTIIQNSDDWEKDDREELVANDKQVLETLASNLQTDTVADRRGQLGASPDQSSNTDDASDWAAPTVNEREKELADGD